MRYKDVTALIFDIRKKITVPQLVSGDDRVTTTKIDSIREKPVAGMSDSELVFIYKNGDATREEVAELRHRIAQKKAKTSQNTSASPNQTQPEQQLQQQPEQQPQQQAELQVQQQSGQRTENTADPLPKREKIADLDPYAAIVDDEADEEFPHSDHRKSRHFPSLRSDATTPTGKASASGKTGGKSSSSSAEGNVATKMGGMLKSALHEPVFIVAFGILLFLLLFLRPFLVPSGSMQPTLQVGDRILSVAQYFPNGATYSRGDIACFTAPDGTVYVKRVIGIGGDHIQISGEKVYVNGEESAYQGTGGVMTSMDVQLADDEYWMMGDNRGNSADSRYIGPVKAEKMISKVFAIYQPLDRIGILE